MELAILAMKKSVDEINKNTPSPRVGAVLVFPDGTYEIACRGEFREGDHAEYTLLDKKNRTNDLTGCWLFATLEPCGPGARNFPKICCAERIANARIEKVWYGVQELNPKAKGGKEYLVKMNVEVDSFDSDLHHKIIDFNKKFNDWVDDERKKEDIAASVNTGFLQQAVKNADISSLSEEALQLYINNTKKTYTYNSDELRNDLIEKNLLEIDEKTKVVRPTGNCILLFGKSPRDKFPQAAVKAKVDYGNGQEPDTKSFNEAIVLVPDLVKQWVKKVIPESMDRSSYTLEKVSHFPPDVIREAIVNAIVHRDYSITGAKIELEITPEKIEVRSPGEPVSPNSISDLKNFTAVSYARNSDLAYIFNLMRLMEESGVGMDTFKSLKTKYDLPLPIITYKKPNVIVTFPRTIEAVRNIGGDAVKELTNEELDGYEWIKSQGEVSAKEYASQFVIASRTASRHLAKMLELKLIKTNGVNPKSPKLRYSST
jgi:ATP-dependent DNA helicase RecG